MQDYCIVSVFSPCIVFMWRHCCQALISNNMCLTSTQTGTSPRLLWQFARPNLQLLVQVWFSINIFQYTLLHSHASQLDHLLAHCSNQCSGISNSVLYWCHLHCVQDNELSFYKGKGILRQIFPLWSLVAIRFF